jgi:hypothetical protein
MSAQPVTPFDEQALAVVRAAGINENGTEELKRLQAQAVSGEQLAASLHVTSEEDYQRVEAELVRQKTLEKAAKDRFDPICKATDTAHKEACRQRNMVLVPIERAVAILNRLAANWLYEKQKAAEEEKRRQLEVAQRAAEEQREREIEVAEQSAATVDEVQSLCDRPLHYEPILPAPKRSPGPVSLRKPTLKATVTNKYSFLEYVLKHQQYINLIDVNESNLNRLVNALQTAAHIPGVQVTPVLSTATRTAPYKKREA